MRCYRFTRLSLFTFKRQRRPFLQSGSKLLCVSDLLLLGRATIEEACSLLHWLDSEEGYGKMGVCGLSMGGVHVAMSEDDGMRGRRKKKGMMQKIKEKLLGIHGDQQQTTHTTTTTTTGEGVGLIKIQKADDVETWLSKMYQWKLSA
ncbi:protein ABHD18 [Tanacetum coccineum]